MEYRPSKNCRSIDLQFVITRLVNRSDLSYHLYMQVQGKPVSRNRLHVTTEVGEYKAFRRQGENPALWPARERAAKELRAQEAADTARIQNASKSPATSARQVVTGAAQFKKDRDTLTDLLRGIPTPRGKALTIATLAGVGAVTAMAVASIKNNTVEPSYSQRNFATEGLERSVNGLQDDGLIAEEIGDRTDVLSKGKVVATQQCISYAEDPITQRFTPILLMYVYEKGEVFTLRNEFAKAFADPKFVERVGAPISSVQDDGDGTRSIRTQQGSVTVFPDGKVSSVTVDEGLGAGPVSGSFCRSL